MWRFPPEIRVRTDTEERQLVKTVLNAALRAADPFVLTSRFLSVKDREVYAAGINLGKPTVIAVGKAAAGMAYAAFAAGLDEGVVVQPRGYPRPNLPFRLVEAGHPRPDQGSLKAAEVVLEEISAADSVLLAISGGSSALMELPEDGLTLEDMAWVYDALTSLSTPIDQLNEVRKHLSSLKGGKLAARMKGKAVALVLSDVPGDDLASVGSAPTIPSKTDLNWVADFISRKGLLREAPRALLDFLRKGKESEKGYVPTFLVGGNSDAVRGAERAAEELGFPVIKTALSGEASEAARQLAARRFGGFLVAGGETTVTLSDKKVKLGKGGRNQEFALSASAYLSEGDALASLATDGIDGPTDAAGAMVDARTFEPSAREYLERHDSYTYLEKKRDLMITGPTGTNVSDVVVAFKKKSRRAPQRTGTDGRLNPAPPSTGITQRICYAITHPTLCSRLLVPSETLQRA